MMNQAHQSESKPIIFMQSGPPHLFHTTGVFYAWELSKRFDIVLLATNAYKEARWFNAVLKLGLFKHIEYFPSKNSINTHHYYVNVIPKLLKRFEPKAALMHSEFFVDNLYLIHFLKLHSPNTRRIYFQPARMGIDVRANSISRHYAQVDNLFQMLKFPSALYGCISKFINFRNKLSFLLNCYILPLLFIKSKFSPPVNYITGDILFANAKEKKIRADQDGVHINYLPIEAASNLEHGAAKVILATHPIQTCCIEVLQNLYGNIDVYGLIFIAPTYGLTSVLIANGLEPSEVISKIAEAWSSAIASLKQQFPSYQIKIKLHPESRSDSIWSEILHHLTVHHPTLQVIDPNEPAEIYTACSKIVVGDISSVLWWASLMGNKVVISLDVFGYPGGDALKPYSDSIFYINNINQIKEVFESINIKNNDANLTNVSDFVENLLKQSNFHSIS